MKKVIIEDDIFQVKAVQDTYDTYGNRWFLFVNVHGKEVWNGKTYHNPTSVELELLLEKLMKEGRV